MAKIIDGKAIAEQIRAEIRDEFTDLKNKFPDADAPNLTVIIVGERKDSQTYVRLKHKAAREVGIHSVNIELSDKISESQLLKTVRRLDDDPHCHGILVQLPLPKHITEAKVLWDIAPEKDVDGLHPTNFGMLTAHEEKPLHYPCTPFGCIELLKRSGVKIEGTRAVVLGRSNIVGIPAAHLLMAENATVTTCHSRTQNTKELCREADIVICATGHANLVRGDWIKPGAAVIDVSTNPIEDKTKKAGFRLVGDCNFEEVSQVAGYITPVPGGVGPMTIAMLLKNTLTGYKRSLVRSGLRL